MSMRISKGNMYDFVTHTWNAIKGKCSHDCEYCYMKQFKLNKLKLDNNELKTNLGIDNFIFVGSSCDMFAEDVSENWISKTLEHCSAHNNKYLFQSKNPKRIFAMRTQLPINSIIGTTIETNRRYKQMGKAPEILERAKYMNLLKKEGFETMVTIEPILDFDIDELTNIIKIINPDWVNIGADSKEHNMPEPNKIKIIKLINELEKFTIIRKKRNIKRLLN